MKRTNPGTNLIALRNKTYFVDDIPNILSGENAFTEKQELNTLNWQWYCQKLTENYI